MSDEQQDQESGQQDQESGQQDQPGPVPYERFKEVNERAKDLEERLEEIERQQKQAEEERLQEQEKWRELAEKRERELEQERLARLRLEVASEAGIPPELAGRLRGEDRDDLLEDAAALKEHLAPDEGPGVPPAGDGGEPVEFDLESMSPAEIREHAAEIMAQR